MSRLFASIFLICAVLCLLLLNLSYHNSHLNPARLKIDHSRKIHQKQLYKNQYQKQSEQDQQIEKPNVEIKRQPDLIPWDGVLLDDDLDGINCSQSLNMSAWNKQDVNAGICVLPFERDMHVTGALLRGDIWESGNQVQLFRDILPRYPEAAFIDIGAHMGLYTISGALLGHRVFAFEPNMDTWEVLKASVGVNKLENRVKIFNYALMDKRHQCVLLSITDETNLGHTVATPANGTSCKKSTNSTMSHNSLINVALLDDLIPHLEELGVKQAVIKIDVEAAEPLVFAGGRTLLRKFHIPNIMMEVEQMRLKYVNKTSAEKRELFDMLTDLTTLGYVATPIGEPVTNRLNLDDFFSWPLTWFGI